MLILLILAIAKGVEASIFRTSKLTGTLISVVFLVIVIILAVIYRLCFRNQNQDQREPLIAEINSAADHPAEEISRKSSLPITIN
jgi:uncharacterized protein YxeA